MSLVGVNALRELLDISPLFLKIEHVETTQI
jgi:hypothetical protein